MMKRLKAILTMYINASSKNFSLLNKALAKLPILDKKGCPLGRGR